MVGALEPVYQVDPLPESAAFAEVDARANAETWADMLHLQAEGTFPATFSAIRARVLMLHGAYDPHPGAMTREVLSRHIPRLEYHEWEDCGHDPWRERGIRDDFYRRVRDWLTSP